MEDFSLAVSEEDDEPESPNQGVRLRHMMRGVLTTCDEPRSPNEEACLAYMMNLNHPIGGGGVFKVSDEPESPHEGACLRYKNRHMKGRV